MASAQMAHAELRNAAARCVVAMIEHEWPQNWPELLEQLDQVLFCEVNLFDAQRISNGHKQKLFGCK